MILLGFGSVGQGFACVLNTKLDFLVRNCKVQQRLVAIVDRGGAAISVNGLDPAMAIEVKKTKKTIAGYPKCGKSLMTRLEILESVEANVAIEALQTWLTESPVSPTLSKQ